MIINLKEISFFEYLAEFQQILPALGIYHVRHSLTTGGALLGAYLDQEPFGIAVLEFAPRPILNYVFVVDKLRKNGIGTKLVQASCALAESKCMVEISANVITQNEHGIAIERMLQKAGFEVAQTAKIIRYAKDEKCRRNWDIFLKERGERICSTLSRRGFRTLPFSEVSVEIMERLKTSIGRDFPSNLNPLTYISNPHDRLVPEYSFMALKNDEPAAFITVTTVDDKTLVFQQMSAAFRHQGSGLFLLPFAAFMEKFLTGSYTKISGMIYDDNERMQSLIKNFIGAMAESIKIQNTYTYKCNKKTEEGKNGYS